MRRLGDRLKRNLEARFLLLENMKSALLRQKALLEAGDFPECAGQCGAVDGIIASLKNQDYEIARLELLSDDVDIIAAVGKDKEMRNLIRKTVGITERNVALVDDLAVYLSKSPGSKEEGCRKIPAVSPTGI